MLEMRELHREGITELDRGFLLSLPDCSLPGSTVHGNFPGKSTGVGCHFLLQGIFPTQGLNLGLSGLPHCRHTLYCLSHQGSLNINLNPSTHTQIRFSFTSHFSKQYNNSSCYEKKQKNYLAYFLSMIPNF